MFIRDTLADVERRDGGFGGFTDEAVTFRNILSKPWGMTPDSGHPIVGTSDTYEYGGVPGTARPGLEQLAEWQSTNKPTKVTCPPKTAPGLLLVLEHTKEGKMTRRRHTPEQVISKLREAEVALAERSTVAEASRRIGVTEQTFYQVVLERRLRDTVATLVVGR